MSGNKFVKGRTNNHLTWMMVDATDFATPESALSAATKIKIYGKTRGATGVNFVSSGTGSLTNDIQHVGASALGIYTIALAKADLSDASAAWYDQYIVSLSATGAAYQTLIVDGGIDDSAISAYQSRLSDLQSYLVALSGVISDAHSAAILAASNASEAQSHATLAASRVLLVQSRLSDLDSRLSSDVSDVLSAANVGNSRILLVQSRLSDLDSRLVSDISDIRSALSDAHSDLASKIGAITVTISASDVSDIASAVVAALPIASDVSDIYSLLSSLNSEFLSRVPKAVATQSLLSDVHSDLRSQIGGITASIGASDISDIASAVRAALVSDLSDILSAATQTNSRVLVVQSMASDAASAAQQANSRVLLNQSRISDVYSLLSDLHSDVAVMSGVVSDVNSALTDIAAVLVDTDTSASRAVGLLDDPRSEQAQGAPAANADAVTKLDYLYQWARNKKENDGTQNLYYADNGTTVNQKQSTSESGGTVTVGEMATGA